jgi:MFS family permease
MLPAAVGGGLLHPSINSLITKRVAEGDIGGMLGMSAAFLSAGNALAPLIGGALFQGLSASAPFLAGGLLIALLYVISVRQIRPGEEEVYSPANLLPSADGD